MKKILQSLKQSLENKCSGYIQLKKQHMIALCVSVAVTGIMIATLSQPAEATKNIDLLSKNVDRSTHNLALPLIADDLVPENQLENSQHDVVKHSISVKSGDTLTHIFRKVGLGPGQVHQISQLHKKTKALSRLQPGQVFHFTIDNEGGLQKLVYQIDKTHSLSMIKKGNTFDVINDKRDFERRVTYSAGSISTSLFDAAQDAGLRDNLTMDLAHIFGWDIDFALDIRKGDQFSVLYESLYLDGEYIRPGNILAAEFINQGKRFQAVRYTDEKGNSRYYSETGESMRKAFLRSPVDFTRISSRFGKRHHPIYKKRRAHKGVDYAASRGTPIKAAGNGKIIFRGKKGGYGKTVIIKHGSQYSTLYAHMNNYNRKARHGSRVKQGQIIGYVGSTGTATGPHLHYEFRVNGVHRNPLTVKLPNAASIAKKYRSDFLAKSRPLIARLAILNNTSVAFNDY